MKLTFFVTNLLVFLKEVMKVVCIIACAINLVMLVGIIVFGIGFSACLGYLVKSPNFYAWSITPMASNTALGFTLTGVGLFVSGYVLGKIRNGKNNR